MYEGRTVSVVMPAYNEESSIEGVILGFKKLGYVDEILVVDNNSSDRTAQIASASGARVIKEFNQGYGFACKRALLEASGDYIILTESDDTFTPRDVIKFLAYTDDFDMVQGTRTTKELIAKSANMRFGLKWGNWLVAKILQVLYNGPALTDMGCTYRLIKKGSLEKIKSLLDVGGSAFLAKMTIAALKQRVKTIEISVNYLERKGKSKITGTFLGAASVALGMLAIIFRNLFISGQEQRTEPNDPSLPGTITFSAPLIPEPPACVPSVLGTALSSSFEFNLKHLQTGLLAFILFSAVMFSFSIAKPFNLDETDFAIAAQSVIKDPAIFSKDPDIGLWHPPVYIYSLALAFKMFGENTVVARGLGVLYYFLGFIFLLLTCRELFKGKEFYLITLIAGAFYLINPILIQYSMLIDIDGGLLMLSTIAFAYFFIRYNNEGMTVRKLVFLGVLIGCMLLIKFTTPPLIAPAIFLFYLSRRDYKGALINTFLIFIIGSTLAFSLWYIYCLIFHVDMLFPIHYTFSTKMSQGGLGLSANKVGMVLISLVFFIKWVSPAFVILMAGSALARVRTCVLNKISGNIDFLLMLGSLVFVFYLYYFPRMAMMKYQTPLYPVSIILISSFIYDTAIKNVLIDKRGFKIIGALVAITTAYHTFLLPHDPLKLMLYGRSALPPFLTDKPFLLAALSLGPFLAVPLFLYFTSTKGKIFSSFILGLFIIAFASEVSLDIKQASNYTTANSWNNYGEKGEAETISYLNERLGPDEPFVARKDIGYYLTKYPNGSTGRNFQYNYIFRATTEKDKAVALRSVIENNPRYIQIDASCNPKNALELLWPFYDLDKSFNDFMILRRKDVKSQD
ncbi:MAG: glycosyltransferase [Candidatus Omnitrophica bacterium]|nr:glycosyltransferase [Candidatus Omnitrophota bacterium]